MVHRIAPARSGEQRHRSHGDTNPDAARGGTFTIVSKNGGLETKQPITVSQEANANVFSGLPATWTFDTASKLTADLKYPADETGSTALFAYDRKGLASDENGVVSITGGYLKLAGVPCGSMAVYTAVSYTHLDVYKRQTLITPHASTR